MSAIDQQNDSPSTVNKERMKMWVDALRSGEYRQTRGNFREEFEGDLYFCALGVVHDLMMKVEGEASGWQWRWRGNDLVWNELANAGTIKPISLHAWLNLPAEGTQVRFQGYEPMGVAYLNDTIGATFEQIADAIERTYLLEDIDG